MFENHVRILSTPTTHLCLEYNKNLGFRVFHLGRYLIININIKKYSKAFTNSKLRLSLKITPKRDGCPFIETHNKRPINKPEIIDMPTTNLQLIHVIYNIFVRSVTVKILGNTVMERQSGKL